MCNCGKAYEIMIVLPICRQCGYYGILPFTNIEIEVCKAVNNQIIERMAKYGDDCPHKKWGAKK